MRCQLAFYLLKRCRHIVQTFVHHEKKGEFARVVVADFEEAAPYQIEAHRVGVERCRVEMKDNLVQVAPRRWGVSCEGPRPQRGERALEHGMF